MLSKPFPMMYTQESSFCSFLVRARPSVCYKQSISKAFFKTPSYLALHMHFSPVWTQHLQSNFWSKEVHPQRWAVENTKLPGGGVFSTCLHFLGTVTATFLRAAREGGDNHIHSKPKSHCVLAINSTGSSRCVLQRNSFYNLKSDILMDYAD